MKPYNTLTVVAIASIIFGSASALHESTHAIVGSFLGAELLLVTSNSVLWSDFSAVLDRGLDVTLVLGLPLPLLMLAKIPRDSGVLWMSVTLAVGAGFVVLGWVLGRVSTSAREA